jgi:hypothetical protein
MSQSEERKNDTSIRIGFCSRADLHAATRSASSPEAERGESCKDMDTGILSKSCDRLRSEAGRDEVIASLPDAGSRNSSHRQICVREGAGEIQLRQHRIFSLLAATSAATVMRSASGSDLLSPRNNKMPSVTSVQENRSSDESRHQMPETSAASSPEHHLTDSDFEELYFPDNLILKELTEMRQILQKLLEQNKELSLITSPLVADDDILSAVLGLRSADAAGQFLFFLFRLSSFQKPCPS